MNWGKALRIGMAIRNMSYKDLAAQAGYSESTISLVCSGQRNPSLEAMGAYSKALNIPIFFLEVLGMNPVEFQEMEKNEKRTIFVAHYLVSLIADQKD